MQTAPQATGVCRVTSVLGTLTTLCGVLGLLAPNPELIVFNASIALIATGVVVIANAIHRRSISIALGFAFAIVAIGAFVVRDFGALPLDKISRVNVGAFAIAALGLWADALVDLHGRRKLVVGAFAVPLLMALTHALVSCALELTAASELLVRALAFVSAAGGIAVIGWALYKSTIALRPGDADWRWVAMPVGLGLAVVAVFIAGALRRAEGVRAAAITATQLSTVRTAIANEMDDRISGLDRMAGRWEVRGDMPRAEWEADALHYAQHYHGYRALEWADTSLRVRWIEPRETNTLAQDHLLASDASRAAIDRALATRSAVITPELELPQGGRGVLAVVPLIEPDETLGFIIGVFDINTLFNAIVPSQLTSGFWVRIDENDHTLYARNTPRLATAGQAETIAFNGASWRVTVGSLAPEHTPMPWVVLLAGLLVAAIVAATLYFGATARLRAEELRAARDDMEGEVQSRTAELRHLNADQKFLVELGETLPLIDDPNELAYQLAKRVAKYLDVARAVFAEVDLVQKTITCARDYHRAHLPSIAGTSPFAAYNEHTLAELKAGHVLTYENAITDARTASSFDKTHKPNGFIASAAVPLLEDGQLAALLTVIHDEPRAWSSREIALTQAVAERAWLWQKRITNRARVVSEHQAAVRDQKFLFELGEALRLTTEPDTVLTDTARRLAEYLGLSRCWFNSIDSERGNFVSRGDYHGDLKSVAGTYALSSFPPENLLAFRAGRSVVNRDTRTDPRTAAIFEPTYRQLGMLANVSVPIHEHNEWTATLVAISAAPRDWAPREIIIVQTVAEKAWLWWTQLNERRRHEQKRQQAARDQVFLYELGEAVRTLDNPDDVFQKAVEQTRAYLGAARCMVSELHLSVGEYRVRAQAAVGVEPLGARNLLANVSPATLRDLVAAKLIVNDDLADDPRTRDEYPTHYGPRNIGSIVHVPLVQEAGMITTFTVSHAQPHAWEPREVALVRAVAEKLWMWAKRLVDRARIEQQLQQDAVDQKFLFDLSEALRPVQEPDEILRLSVRRLAEHLKLARCFFVEVDVVADRATTRSDHHRDDLRALPSAFPLSTFASDDLAEAEIGRFAKCDDAATDPRTTAVFARSLKSVALRAFLIMPLLHEQEWQAALVAADDAPRAWTPRDITLVQAVADKTWLWYQQVVDRAAAERDRQQRWHDQQFLIDLNESSRVLEDRNQLIAHMVTETAVYLGASRCFVSEVDIVGETYTVRPDYRESHLGSIAGGHPLPATTREIMSALSQQRTLVNENTRADSRTSHLWELVYKPIDMVACIVVPMFRDERLNSVLNISHDQPRIWTEREVALAQAVSEKMWVWLKHAEMLGALRESESSLKTLAASLETRVKERTRELEASQDQLHDVLADLSRSNAELQQFAYVASHDLRAPLRAIDTLAEWIQKDLKDVLQGETAEQMQLLRGRVNRMEQLLADLLEYARAGRDMKKIELVATKTLFTEALELTNTPPGIVVQTSGELPLVETPRLPLKRVLINLISNAVKHHDKKVGAITVSARDLGDVWEFSVADDGPGIPPRFHMKAFQMFQTLRSRDEVEGSGMGLALVKKLVESAGGQITLESSGRGATFRFTWPKVFTPPHRLAATPATIDNQLATREQPLVAARTPETHERQRK